MIMLIWLVPLVPKVLILLDSSSEESMLPSIARAMQYESSFRAFKIRSPSFLLMISSRASEALSGVFSSANSIISKVQYLLSLFEYSSTPCTRYFSFNLPTQISVILILYYFLCSSLIYSYNTPFLTNLSFSPLKPRLRNSFWKLYNIKA